VYVDEFDGSDDERVAAALAAAAEATYPAGAAADPYRHVLACPVCGSGDVDVACHATPVPVVTWMRCRSCGIVSRPRQ
jgi:hypothetical protein